MRCHINGHVRSLANGRVQIGVDPYGSGSFIKHVNSTRRAVHRGIPFGRLFRHKLSLIHDFSCTMVSALFLPIMSLLMPERSSSKLFSTKIMSASFAQSSVKDIQRFFQGS